MTARSSEAADVGEFRTAPTRIAGERDRRLALAARALLYHHAFLDDLLRGLQPHDLVLLGAETGAGKTELGTAVARANAMAGKRVYYFALEAEPDEIERRSKYAIIAELAEKAGDARRSELNYPDWLVGNCEDICERYNARADQLIAEKLSKLHTYYRGANFGHADIQRMFERIRGHAELVVLDHLHYVDIEDENEHRGFKATVKLIRELALSAGVPVILIAHLRKRDQRARQVVPHIEDFHGSSDIIKICTQVVQLAPAHILESPKWFYAPTFVHVPKDRRGGATGFVACCYFDRRFRAYAPHYTLGRLTSGGTDWEPIRPGDAPRWARRHRDMEAT
ncbi:MAG: AAA family ATPase [Deltaproteobacteria bacterium]|nr:AAA family ATPase [Deltaproteobacteria bacterium]